MNVRPFVLIQNKTGDWSKGDHVSQLSCRSKKDMLFHQELYPILYSFEGVYQVYAGLFISCVMVLPSLWQG